MIIIIALFIERFNAKLATDSAFLCSGMKYYLREYLNQWSFRAQV